MSTLTIRTQNKCNTTTIENYFIDAFMPRANGEYVKIYLYLIRIMNDPNCGLTLAKIADTLEHTEKDILRAFNYWEREGLISISWDQNMNITTIDIVPATSATPRNLELGDCPSLEVNNIPDETPTTILPTMSDLEEAIMSKSLCADMDKAVEPVKLDSYKARKDYKNVLFMTETYLGKTLSKSETDMLSFYFDDLLFPTELIEFLIEYCVENGHKSMRYINAVAVNWANEGIKTVEEAKIQINGYNKSYYIILRSFGISGRSPIQLEVQFMDKWMTEYGFSLEIINEACAKTIATAQKPSFPYADSILESWKKQNVKYLDDIRRLDDAYKANAVSKPATNQSRNKPTTNNFEQRNYDFDMIQQQLFNVQ